MRRKLFCALLILFILLTMPQVNALESINEAIQNGIAIIADLDIFNYNKWRIVVVAFGAITSHGVNICR